MSNRRCASTGGTDGGSQHLAARGFARLKSTRRHPPRTPVSENSERVRPLLQPGAAASGDRAADTGTEANTGF